MVRRFLVRVSYVLAVATAASAVIVGAGWLWLRLRPQPEPVRERWLDGVSYERLVLQDPRPLVAHVVRIDLERPGIDFVVSPPEPSPGGEVRSRTTTAFVAERGVQLAINASYFYPFRNEHPLDYEPHPGDPVHALGKTASRGAVYGRKLPGEATLYLSSDGRASFDAPLGQVWNAVSGLGYVVRDGQRAAFQSDLFTGVPYPRTLVATDAASRSLMFVVIDGKQPGYSEGLTLHEAADLLLRLGAHTAIQLDGGGSATLARRIGPDDVELVSMPANFKIPGWERSVATHLGVRARPLQP